MKNIMFYSWVNSLEETNDKNNDPPQFHTTTKREGMELEVWHHVLEDERGYGLDQYGWGENDVIVSQMTTHVPSFLS